jgi:hypothetical protein
MYHTRLRSMENWKLCAVHYIGSFQFSILLSLVSWYKLMMALGPINSLISMMNSDPFLSSLYKKNLRWESSKRQLAHTRLLNIEVLSIWPDNTKTKPFCEIYCPVTRPVRDVEKIGGLSPPIFSTSRPGLHEFLFDFRKFVL